jgi:hypothetical protein
MDNINIVIAIICILFILNLINNNETFDNNNINNNNIISNKPNLLTQKTLLDNNSEKTLPTLDTPVSYYTYDDKDINTNNFTNNDNNNVTKLTSVDLLPNTNDKNEYNEYMIDATYDNSNLLFNGTSKLGENTIGATRRNASYDLRGTVPCPKMVVSPWQNSTYEPDANIKSLY